MGKKRRRSKGTTPGENEKKKCIQLNITDFVVKTNQENFTDLETLSFDEEDPEELNGDIEGNLNEDLDNEDQHVTSQLLNSPCHTPDTDANQPEMLDDTGIEKIASQDSPKMSSPVRDEGLNLILQQILSSQESMQASIQGINNEISHIKGSMNTQCSAMQRLEAEMGAMQLRVVNLESSKQQGEPSSSPYAEYPIINMLAGHINRYERKQREKMCA